MSTSDSSSTTTPVLATGTRRWLWLLLAAATGLVATGSWTIPLATWISAAFMLRFTRSMPAGRGYLCAALATVPVLAISWAIFPFGGTIGLVIFALVASFIGSLPLLLDRLLAHRLRGIARTLVFPVAATALEFLGHMNDDFGSWGATAYTQVDHPALLQLVSLVGLPGLAFLLAWFASSANALWESGWSLRASWRSSALFAGILATVLGFGALRLATAEPPAETARVAAISTARWGSFGDKEILGRFKGDDPLSAEDLEAIRRYHTPQNERLLEAAQREAQAGAQLVVWAEAAAVVLDVDADAYLARGQAVASAQGITLAMAVGVLDSGAAPRRIANELVLITPDGEIASTYRKAIPTPGGERAWSHRGDGELQVVDTPVGLVAGVICYDADFPDLVAQAGEQDVDLLLVPAGDWDAVATMHADMARVRAVEQGVSLLRPAAAGLSTAVDPYGRVLAQHRWVDGPDTAALVAWVPTRGLATLYSRVGGSLGWVCALALVGLIVAGSVRAVRAAITSRKSRRT